MYPAFNNCAIPAFDPHGNSFFHGVKFSVQTISLGRDEYLRNVELTLCMSPLGLRDISGVIVFVVSIKLREAQSNPERELANATQFLSTSMVSSLNHAQTSAPGDASVTG